MSDKRMCEGRFWTGPHRDERCFHPATRFVETYGLYLCGYHARAYTQSWPLSPRTGT